MSPELKAIADGVMPFNRERAAEQMHAAFEAGQAFAAELRRVTVILGPAARAIAASHAKAIRALAKMAPPDPSEPSTR